MLDVNVQSLFHVAMNVATIPPQKVVALNRGDIQLGYE
jgi:hypothetical protein